MTKRIGFKDMRVGLRYVCVRRSKDGSVQRGDHLWVTEGGYLMCPESGGWINPDCVESATKWMRVTIDEKWLNLQLSHSQQQVRLLSKAKREFYGKVDTVHTRTGCR